MFKLLFILWQLFQQFIRLDILMIIVGEGWHCIRYQLPIYSNPFLGLAIKPPSLLS